MRSERICAILSIIMEMIAYELIRSSRRTMSVEVDSTGGVLVRAPRLMPKWRVEAFVRERQDWIVRAKARQAKRQEKLPDIREEDKPLYVKRAGKNRLSFSWRLMAYPEAAIDYVVVHELAHIRYKDHSRAFYGFIESVLPDYRDRIRLLKGI